MYRHRLTHAAIVQIGIMFIFILAILGTFFFQQIDNKNFGTMFRTTYTLWTALAFGEWEVLPVISKDGSILWERLLYLILVVLLLLWITLNVIVTILLDKFVRVWKTNTSC